MRDEVLAVGGLETGTGVSLVSLGHRGKFLSGIGPAAIATETHSQQTLFCLPFESSPRAIDFSFRQ